MVENLSSNSFVSDEFSFDKRTHLNVNPRIFLIGCSLIVWATARVAPYRLCPALKSLHPQIFKISKFVLPGGVAQSSNFQIT